VCLPSGWEEVVTVDRRLRLDHGGLERV
jgi:hypothetical protein